MVATLHVAHPGATSHMCKDIGLFVTFEPLESSMETAANPFRILGKGTVRFPVKDATKAVRSVELKDVNYVPRVAHSLFSVIKALVNDGFKININKWECTLRHDGGGYVLLVSMSVLYLPMGMLLLKRLCGGIGGLDTLA
ncbi:unnamed protein product [Phytophthora fragariaefolia]|uniref:Unnamed protein product n=1 Tax=Phytophthora fragariaefolia TaxID=1490495 RepID=A0A9W6X8A7_9STRA|nr:unnamed protein product [Phytophthora fragariaefolia]